MYSIRKKLKSELHEYEVFILRQSISFLFWPYISDDTYPLSIGACAIQTHICSSASQALFPRHSGLSDSFSDLHANLEDMNFSFISPSSGNFRVF